MIHIYKKIHQLNFGQLMDVYAQSNQHDGDFKYPKKEFMQRIMEAEQDHYAFLQEFFKCDGAFLAVMEAEGAYVAALRIEPYRDGYLLEGLETATQKRRRGYARQLINGVMLYLKDRGAVMVYSHIDKDNISSIKVHEACLFKKISDHALFIDGSVDHHTFTYVKEL